MGVWRKWSKKKKIIVILCPSLLLLLVLALFIPELILKKSWEGETGKVSISDKDFQGDELQVFNTSMDFFDKVVLLNQNVDKNEFEINDPLNYDCMSLSEAVIRAREEVAKLYEDEMYPVLLEGYKNWYSYSGSLYQYTEQYFSNYSCFVWKIIFKLYDGNVQQVIHMDAQTGKIFKAMVTGAKNVSGYVGDQEKKLNYGNKGSLYQISRKDSDKFYFFYTESLDKAEIARAQKVDIPEYDLRVSDVKTMVNAPESVSWKPVIPDGVVLEKSVTQLTAPVIVPDKEGMKIQPVRRKQIPESDIQKWYDGLFPEGAEYNPRALVNQVVQATHFLIDHDDGFDYHFKIDYQNFLQCFDSTDENADKFKYIQLMDYNGQPYPNFSALVNYNGYDGYFSVKDTEIASLLYGTDTFYSGSPVVRRNEGVGESRLVFKDESDLSAIKEKIPSEIQLCEDFINETGLEGYKIDCISFYDFFGEPGYQTYIYYSRAFEGLYLSDAGTLGVESFHDRLLIGVRDGTIFKFELGAQLEPEGDPVRNVQLLPFSDIQENIHTYVTQNGGIYHEPDALSIRLEYAIIDDPDNRYESIIIPVWNCYSGWITDNGTEISYMNEFVVLSINAIDGSIVADGTIY